MNERFEMMPEELQTGVDEIIETNKSNEEQWTLSDGTPCSKSAFIREQFLKFNKSRKQIAEEFGIPYRTVYGATVNLVNDAEPTARGRGVTFQNIKVTVDGRVVMGRNGKIYINGEELPEGAEIPETIEVNRNEWLREMVSKGVSRRDLAKWLDLSYGVIYNATKDLAGPRKKYEIQLEDGTIVSRSEYIRQLVESGMSKSEVAKKLGVEYSVVWQATKKLKTEGEKFHEAIHALERFKDLVNDPATLQQAIDMLSNLHIIEEDVVTGEADEENIEE